RRMAAEPGWQAGGDRLADATGRVAGLLALVDPRDDAALGLRIGHAERRRLRALGDLRRRERPVVGGDPADLGDPAVHADTERREQALREAADGDSCCGLARARALQHVADGAALALELAGESGVARPRPRD